MRTMIVVLALLSALLPAVADAQVYRWTDENGRVHYGDKPPAQAKTREVIDRISSYAGPAQVSSAPQQASARKASARVVMYTTPTCGYCRQAKAHFNYRRVAFEERDVEHSTEFRREFYRLGGRGVPVILVGEKRMDGYDRRALDAMLTAEGL